MLGDAYGAAVVEALSRKELQAMDGIKEEIEEAKLDEEALIGLYKTPSTESSNGSSVKVREVSWSPVLHLTSQPPNICRKYSPTLQTQTKIRNGKNGPNLCNIYTTF